MAYRGYNTPTLQQIQSQLYADINNNLPGQDASIRYTELNSIANALAAIAYGQYGYQTWIAKQTNVLDCENENLETWGVTFGIIRKIPTYATGTVTFTGLASSVIPAGTIISSASGLQFATTAEGTIAGLGASATVPVKALNVGIDFNLPASTQLSTVTALSGINSAVTVVSLSGGTSLETDDEYRARILLRIQNGNPTGTATDYVQWALACPGVTRAWCTPLESGAGTVGLRFMMDDTYSNGIPQSGDVASVQAYIDSVRPICATVTVSAPTATALNITITGLSPTSSTIQANIQSELKAMIRNKAYPGGIIYRSWIWEAVSLATGVQHHQITTPSADVSYSSSQICVLGTITYA